MTKQELIETVINAQDGDTLGKKEVESIIAQTFLAIAQSIKKTGRFSYPNFGTFTVSERAARQGRNPQTGESLEIKASKSVKFKPAPSLKEGL